MELCVSIAFKTCLEVLKSGLSQEARITQGSATSHTHEVACPVLLATNLESLLKLAASNSSLAKWQVLGVKARIASFFWLLPHFAGFEHWGRQRETADSMILTSTTMTPTTTTITTTVDCSHHHHCNYSTAPGTTATSKGSSRKDPHSFPSSSHHQGQPT